MCGFGGVVDHWSQLLIGRYYLWWRLAKSVKTSVIVLGRYAMNVHPLRVLSRSDHERVVVNLQHGLDTSREVMYFNEF